MSRDLRLWFALALALALAGLRQWVGRQALDSRRAAPDNRIRPPRAFIGVVPLWGGSLSILPLSAPL